MEEQNVWLNGPLERAQWPPLLTATLGLLLAFVLFQLVISPLVLVLGVLSRGQDPSVLMDLPRLVQGQPGLLLLANTAGQVLGLALPAWLLTRLHTRQAPRFLRLQPLRGSDLGWALLGLAFLIPVVQWLGHVNEALPLPESWRAFDAMQMELIEAALRGGLNVGANLLVLAVVPAFCEELLFRGYVQRQAERSLGAAGGILFSGIVFGLYHLRLTQALPLCVLGVYLAYLVWRTGSLWSAVAVHLANNAFSVLLAAYAEHHPRLSWQDLEQLEVPWYLVALGLIGFGWVLFRLERRTRLTKNLTEPLP